jgi:hypothetical protein
VNANLAKVSGMVFGAQRSAQRIVEKVRKEFAPAVASAMFANQAIMADSAINSALRTAQIARSMTT